MSDTADTGQGDLVKDSLAGGDAKADENSQSHDNKTESMTTKPTESTEQESNEMKEERERDEGGKTDEAEEKEEEYVDVLGNGTLLKKVLQKGSGDRPMMGDKVTITWSKEIPELGLSFPEEELTFILGDGDEVQAIDLCVALMYLEEVAVIVAGYKYMYGELGLEPDIPARANFKLTVHLKHTDGPLDYPSLTFNERFSEAKKKKERGNFLFKRKEFALALNSYTKASKIVDPNLGCVFNDESAKNLQELLEFRAIVLCNTSVCQFRLEAYDAAVKSASEACKLWPSYSKAYCRLGQAQEKLGHITETIQSYKLALKNDAENSKWLHGELERLTKLNKKNKKSQQEMYSKMFWGSNPPSLNNSPIKAKDPSLLFTDYGSTGADFEPFNMSNFNPCFPTVSNQGASASATVDNPFDFLLDNPMFEAGRQLAKQQLSAGLTESQALEIAGMYINMLRDEASKYDPAQLLMIAGQMEAMIPPEVRAYLESVTKDITTSSTEEQVLTAEKVEASIASSSLNVPSLVNTNNGQKRDLGNTSDHQQRDRSNNNKIQERDLGNIHDIQKRDPKNTHSNQERDLESTYGQAKVLGNTCHLRERAPRNTHDWERDSENRNYDQTLRAVTVREINKTEEVDYSLHPKKQLRFCFKDEEFKYNTDKAKKKLRIRRAISLAIRKRILKSHNNLNSNFILEDPLISDVDYGLQGDQAEVDTCDRNPEEFSWLWKTGATVCGAGLVGLAGIGLYKYMNH